MLKMVSLRTTSLVIKVAGRSWKRCDWEGRWGIDPGKTSSVYTECTAVSDSLKKDSCSHDLCPAQAHRNTGIWAAATGLRPDPHTLSMIHWKAWETVISPNLSSLLLSQLHGTLSPVNAVSKSTMLWRINICNTVENLPRTYQWFFTSESCFTHCDTTLNSLPISFHDETCRHTGAVCSRLPYGMLHQLLNLIFPHSAIFWYSMRHTLMATAAYHSACLSSRLHISFLSCM